LRHPGHDRRSCGARIRSRSHEKTWQTALMWMHRKAVDTRRSAGCRIIASACALLQSSL
jgi:hypothetical protein